MSTFAALLIVPWLLTLLLMPGVIRWATRHGYLDHPSERKQHTQPVPVLGGVALFTAIALALLLLAPWVPEIRERAFGPRSLTALGAGVAAILALGLYDDLRDLAPTRKLAFQILIAIGTWAVGFSTAETPLLGDMAGWSWTGPIISFTVTIGWIVVVTNAFNLIDGMDGLAAGISVLALLTIFLLANGNGATVPVIGALVLSGALAAFLRFNLPPARIFLGDAGSMGIGYATAVLALASYQKAPTGVALIVPLVVVGLPMLDTGLAILRRGWAHLRRPETTTFHPLAIARAVFAADRGHVHHVFLRLGWSVGRVLTLLYGVSAALAAVGLATRGLPTAASWVLWMVLLAAAFIGLRALERRVERIEAAQGEKAVGDPAAQELGQRATG
jgi:UDP-GlcNAc:undecaprenyl-phosphate GlcNAc-1-phosphate transferase